MCLLSTMLILLGIFLVKTAPTLLGLGFFALAGNILGILMLARRQKTEARANTSQEEELLIAQIMTRISKENSDKLSQAQTTYNAIIKKYPYHKNLLLAKYSLFSMAEDAAKETNPEIWSAKQRVLDEMLSNLSDFHISKK